MCGQYHPAPAGRFCLGAVNQMLAGVGIDKLAGLLKDMVWLLGFLVTVFVG